MDKRLYLVLHDVDDFMYDAEIVEITPNGVFFDDNFVSVSQLKHMKKRFASFIKKCNEAK